MLMFKRFFLMDAAGDANGGAGAGGADTAAGGAGAADTLLAQGKAAAVVVNDDTKVDPLAWMPERFRVAKEDKSLDMEQSARKVAESYTQLEKRMKDTGLPPDTPDGYEFKAPDNLKLDDALTKEFKAKAHEMGMTKKQFDFVMQSYVQTVGRLPEQMDALIAQRAKDSKPVMVKAFGSEAAFKEGMTHAAKAVDVLLADAPEEVKANADMLGNSPAFLWMAAKYGKEMGEDTSILLSQRVMPEAEIAALTKDMKSAYWNPLDPGHEAAKIKVAKHFEAQAKLQQQQRQ
jgi:hypothetical protein